MCMNPAPYSHCYMVVGTLLLTQQYCNLIAEPEPFCSMKQYVHTRGLESRVAAIPPPPHVETIHRRIDLQNRVKLATHGLALLRIKTVFEKK